MKTKSVLKWSAGLRTGAGWSSGFSLLGNTLKRELRLGAVALAFAALAAGAPLFAATNNLTSLLQQGLFEEEANRNLDAAIASYQSLATQFDKDRQIAATAIFRLGECYRKLGKTNEAVIQYERIVREFPDQTALAMLSRQDLVGLGAGAATSQTSAATAPSPAARAEQRRLLEEEIGLLEKQLADRQKLVDQKITGPSELLPLQREILALKRQIAALSDESQPTASEAGAAITDEEEKEIRRIQSMIQNSPDLIDAPDKDGWTPLQHAAAAGQLRVARYLLDNQANMERKNPNGDTPLTSAASLGHKAIVELLLSRGANLKEQGQYGYTALHQAAAHGFAAVAEVLLANKADINARTDSKNGETTPLHLAAGADRINVMKLLLANGADVRATNVSGFTPLHSAASGGRTAAIGVLLQAKAEVNARTRDGETPLLFAAKNAKRDAAEALLAAGADPKLATTGGYSVHLSPLHCAVAAGDETLTRELLERGAEPNLSATRRLSEIGPSGPSGWAGPGPALITACDKNNAAIVKILLDHGADPNVRSADDAKVPLLSSTWFKPEILQLLLDHKADPNLTDHNGYTSLHNVAQAPASWSAQSGVALTNIIALLVEHGADVNARIKGGYTPLHFAVGQNNLESVAALLAFKADPNIRNDQGETPLDSAKRSQPGFGGGSPGGLRTIPPRTMTLPGGRRAPQSNPTAEIGIPDLLRQHGALDQLPHLDRVELTRPSANFSTVIFSKGPNDWNRFTLLEAIAQQYNFINTQTTGESSLKTGSAISIWPGMALGFPDFKAVVIHRPSADGKTWKSIPVNVADILSSGDCSRDVGLQWGDVVEIPEADHPVAEKWPGLTEPERNALIKCVSRTVTISINNANTAFSVAPVFVSAPQGSTMEFYGRLLGPGEVGRRSVSFMVRSVLDQSKLIRFSSDLSRVKVSRRDPASGKAQSWLVDCSSANNPPDLWLRDGDVIEVPEK